MDPAQVTTLPLHWTDPNPPGVVDSFTYFAALPGEFGLVSVDLGMPTPDAEGVYHATISVPGEMAYVGLAAHGGGQQSFLSNVKFIPEPGSLGLIVGLVVLALLGRWR